MIKVLVPYIENKTINNIIIYQIIRFIGNVDISEARKIMESMRNQEDVKVIFNKEYWTDVKREFQNRSIVFQIL